MLDDIPQTAKDIAWKARLRLSKRYRQLEAKGKKAQIAVTAVARELVGFMWAIACTLRDERMAPAAQAARRN